MQPQGPYGPQPPYPSQPAPGQPPQGQPVPPQPYIPGQPAPNPYAQQPGGIVSPVPPTPAGPPANPYAAAQPPTTPYTPPPGTTSKPGTAVIPPPPPRPETPYDFFMQPNKPKSPSKPFSLPGNKFVWIIGGVVGLLLIITIAALAAPKDASKAALVLAAQTQTETLRLCGEGVKDAKLQATKSFAYNCVLSQSTDSRQLVAQLGKSGIKLNAKNLAATRSASNDSKLKAAKASSNYDETFVGVIETQLNTQLRVIKQAAADPEANTDERKLLTTYHEHTTLLAKQLKPTE